MLTFALIMVQALLVILETVGSSRAASNLRCFTQWMNDPRWRGLVVHEGLTLSWLASGLLDSLNRSSADSKLLTGYLLLAPVPILAVWIWRTQRGADESQGRTEIDRIEDEAAELAHSESILREFLKNLIVRFDLDSNEPGSQETEIRTRLLQRDDLVGTLFKELLNQSRQ